MGVTNTAVANSALVGDASESVCTTVGLLAGTSVIETVGTTGASTSVLITSLLPG